MCTTPALRWMLVSLASLVLTSWAAPTDQSDLVIVTTGVPATSTFHPEKSADLLLDADVTIDSAEGPMPPLKVTSMNVTSVINLRYAHTTVLTKMKNPAKIAQEATFRIILPETAFITGFVMTLDGIPYTAYVKDKEEAKNIYTQAVNQGLGAAHIAAKARDSNHFTVSVNVEPSTKALFNLTYEELLTRRLEVYNHVVNLNPGRLVPDLTVNIFIKEGRKITTLRVPELRTGNEVDAQASDTANEFATIERNGDNTEAYIKFAPNLEQQQTLMQVYAEKSRKSASHLRWTPYGPEPSTDGGLGQFVLQYDVERDPNNGEVLVNDGYFVHFFSPSGLKPLNKYAIFVLDTSISMIGKEIEQLKEAMTSILSELKPGDYFNIIEFNTIVQIYDIKNSKSHQKSEYTFLPPPASATPDNIQKAKEFITNLQASGSTNIYGALTLAVELAKTSIPKSKTISANLSEAPHTDLLENDNSGIKVDADVEDKKPDPIIIFLTDGEPTMGETNTERILGGISELNSGPNQAPIFTLAFGHNADRDFLHKLALRNSGFLRHIYEGADAAQQLQQFYSQVADPLLSHIRFTYPADQIDDTSVTKFKFKTLFCGTELVVADVARMGGLGDMRQMSAISYSAPIASYRPRAPNGLHGSVRRDDSSPRWSSHDNTAYTHNRAGVSKLLPMTMDYDDSVDNDSDVTDFRSLSVQTTSDDDSKVTTLKDYNLSEFQWLEQYLDAASDSVNLPVNGTTVNLKLFKGTTPAFTSAEPACTMSLTVGSVGTCKYLAECAAAKNISSLDVYLQHRCDREGYAAVCCPAQA